jgi:hypothetical protein
MSMTISIPKAAAVLAAAILCTALAAQDFKVAMTEPTGKVDAALCEMVATQLAAAITKTDGFLLFDRANIDQVVGEHAFQNDTSLVSPTERIGRELGQFKGADLVVTTKLSMYGRDLQMASQVQDIVSNEVVASGTRLVEGAATRQVMDAALALMGELLKDINNRLSGGLRRAEPPTPLSGLDETLRRTLLDDRSVSKWAKRKDTAALQVDLSMVSLAESRQLGALAYRASGSVRFLLGPASTSIEIEPVVETSHELLRQKIRAQLQPRAKDIIKALLAQLG